jgi:hypothetical protein
MRTTQLGDRLPTTRVAIWVDSKPLANGQNRSFERIDTTFGEQLRTIGL